MNSINASKALLDMQRMAAQSQVKTNFLDGGSQSVPGGTQGFSEMLQQAVSNVNEVQKEAGTLKKAFEIGDPSVDLPQVMIASQKAGVAFEAMVQVRNKLLQAYKDVMSMPV